MVAAIFWTLCRVFDLLVGWLNRFYKLLFAVWNLVPLCLMWLLWREWNSYTLEDVEVLEVRLRISFLRLLYEWSTVLGFTDSGTNTEFTSVLSFTCNYLDIIL